MAPASVIDAMESKILQINIARQCGFNLLPTTLVSTASPAECAQLTYPVVVRPDRASLDSSFKAVFLADSVALKAFIGSRDTRKQPVVAQSFVSGPTVVIHGFRARVAGVASLIGFIVTLKNDGVTVTLEPWELSPGIADACQRFVQAAGIVGVFHFELLLDPTTMKLWFLEVNVRLGGTTGKVLVAGYDEPAALLYAFGVIDEAPQSPQSYKRVVNRLAALRCLEKAIRGNGSPVDYPFPDARQVEFRALRSILLYRDEVLRPCHTRNTLAFLSQYISW
jgi:predicted ATP-grasp superfamily ATP-dependent carboligase